MPNSNVLEREVAEQALEEAVPTKQHARTSRPAGVRVTVERKPTTPKPTERDTTPTAGPAKAAHASKTAKAVESAASAPKADEFGRFPSRERRRKVVAAALLVSDAVMLVLSALAATLVRYDHFEIVLQTGGRDLSPLRLGQTLVVVLTLLGFLAMRRLYDLDHLGWGSGEFIRVAQSLTSGVIAVVIGSFLLGQASVSREWVVLALLLSMVLVTSGRLASRLLQGALSKRLPWLLRPTLIVGSNMEAAEIARVLCSDTKSGLVPVGCLSSSQMDKLSFDYCEPFVPVLGTARDLVRVVTTTGIDSVVIVASAFDYEILKRMIVDLRDVPVGVHLSSGLSDILSSRIVVRALNGVPVISVNGASRSRLNLLVKRTFDLVVGAVIILAGMPLWIAIASMIKLTSPGPVFYRQERVGKNGRLFGMFKFRTMVDHADEHIHELLDLNEADGPLFKIADDPRLTGVGKWLRKFSLDEFPQLLNVMTGEMSLVGPRPPLESETLTYSDQDRRRLEVVPGMTGLWQVSGRSNLAFNEMVRLDVFYIDNWSVTLDLSLLARTLPAILTARGAY